MNIFIPLGGDTGEEEEKRRVVIPEEIPAKPQIVPSEPVPA